MEFHKIRTVRSLFLYAVAFPAIALLLITVYVVQNSEILTLFRMCKTRQGHEDYVGEVSSDLASKEKGNLTPFKQILIWNTPNTIQKIAFGIGYEGFLRNNCRYKHCVLVENSSLLNLSEVDALLINIPELWLSKMPPDFQRSPSQRFIFFALEPPVHFSISQYNFTRYFNWTMSYRQDSDISLPYGQVTRKLNSTATGRVSYFPGISGTRNYAANKTKLVAWFVSHCSTASQREKYVKELQKYIPVDVYGGCGYMSCKRDNAGWLSTHECYLMLEKKYKFYLSFENSICAEYVTEKFFSPLQHRIVPVVYGGANYSEIAPEHSYIDANQLSAKELAELLVSLDKNDTLYNEYFWWKDYYDVEYEVDVLSGQAFCNLCEKLHTDFETKVYETMATNWDQSIQCIRPRQTF